MILRRISKGIKDQDWFVVMVEVMIVVVGIFIGLQVDDWNDERKDRVDESAFLSQLHDDLVLAETASVRVLERRFSTFNDLTSAMKVLVSGDEQETLGNKECNAIGNSSLLHIIIADLPSLAELQSAGRIGIIENSDLRRSAISLQQRIIALKEIIPFMTTNNYDLPNRYPDVFRLSSVIDLQLNEVDLSFGCDLEAMRENVGFMFAVGLNFDIFDAYLRDGLRPWKEQFNTLHDLTDQHLGLNHSIIANQ